MITVLENGYCTKDLSNLYEGIEPKPLTTTAFLEKVRETIDAA